MSRSHVADRLRPVSSVPVADVLPATRARRRPFFPEFVCASAPTPDSGVVTRQYAHVMEAAILPSRQVQACRYAARGAYLFPRLHFPSVLMSRRWRRWCQPAHCLSVCRISFSFNDLRCLLSVFPQACYQNMWISRSGHILAPPVRDRAQALPRFASGLENP